MPDWPLDGGLISKTYGAVAATSSGTVVTAHASANAKGAYAEITAATDYSASYITVDILHTGEYAAARDFLVDLAIGAGGSETVILPNLLFSPGMRMFVPTTYSFPIFLPAGTRLSARCQSTTGAETCAVIVELGCGGELEEALALVSSFGPNVIDSGGTSIDPGGTAHTKGAWVQLRSSTPYPIKTLVLALGTANNANPTVCNHLIDVGVGAAGSEAVILANIPAGFGNYSGTLFPKTRHYSVYIPVGSRLAVRAQCSINDATDRLLDAALYCSS